MRSLALSPAARPPRAVSFRPRAPRRGARSGGARRPPPASPAESARSAERARALRSRSRSCSARCPQHGAPGCDGCRRREGPVPNLERRLGGFDRRLALEPEAAGDDRPPAAPIARGAPRRQRLRLSLPRGAGALPRTGSQGRAISPRRGSSRRAAARSDRPAGRNQDPRSRSSPPHGKARAERARCGGARFLSPRARFGARRACRGSSGNVRRGGTIPASCAGGRGPAQRCFQSSRQRCSVSASSPVARASSACAKAYWRVCSSSRWVSSACFASRAASSIASSARQIRVNGKALEFGDELAERGRALVRRTLRRATAAMLRRAASAPPRCDRRSPEGGPPRGGRGGRSIHRSPSRPPLALFGFPRPRAPASKASTK